MSKLENKIINFTKSVNRLKEAAIEFKQENASDVIRDGLIQRFEFTYELGWKTMKEYLEDIGIVEKNSPKAVIKEAYAQKLIINENNWLLMLNDRKLTSHVYKEEIAEEIAERIVTYYITEFDLLLEKMERYLAGE